MKREQLEHLIRAAAALTNEYEIMIIGSQSILGSHPNAPDCLLQSMEADFYIKSKPDLSDLIDGSIGEMSIFDDKFGYYAQGVDDNTAKLPDGWQNRLVKIQNKNTNMMCGFCLEENDLAISKLMAGREKDWEFVSALIKYHLADAAIIASRLTDMVMNESQKKHLLSWVARESSGSDDAPPEPSFS
jgi:hypothetical protein